MTHPKNNRRRRLSDDDVQWIRELHMNRMQQKRIALIVNCSRSCVSLILSGKRHRAKPNA